MGNQDYRDERYDYRDDRYAEPRRYRDERSSALGPIRDARDVAAGSLRYARDHAFEAVSETVHEIGRRAQRVGYSSSNFVGTHAVPLTLLGLGLGMLAVSVSRQRNGGAPITLPTRASFRTSRDELARSYGQPNKTGFSQAADSLTQTAGGIAHAAGDLAGAARERVGALADRAAHSLHDKGAQVRELAQAARGGVGDALGGLRDQASEVNQRAVALGHDLSDQASEIARRGYEQLQRGQARTLQFTEENPLMVGALAVVAGVGVGLLLPATRTENQLIGDSRDRLWQEAQRTASRLGETVQHSASELKGALLE